MYYVERSYRKRVESYGSIYMGGEERAITIKNMSITGALAELNSNQGYENTRDIYNALSTSTMIDVRLPEMRLVGDAEVVRVDMDDERTFIAIEFKRIKHDVDNLLYKRKFYRENLAVTGRILLNNEYREFTTVNVSSDGLMILLAGITPVEEGMVTFFEFQLLELEGHIKVIWVNHPSDAETMVGFQYMYTVNAAIDGLPVLI